MEHIGKSLLREIVNGEVKGILARAVGIVAEVDRGFPIALLAAGLLALSFMGFSGFKVFG